MSEYDERPSTPYPDGTGGHSGGETSRARAISERDDGTLTARQEQTMRLLAARGRYGATWQEIAEGLNLHHGQSSGVLSNLHHTGRISRLKATRGRCSVYVLPVYEDGRETVTPRRNGRRERPPAAALRFAEDYRDSTLPDVAAAANYIIRMSEGAV